MKQEIAARYRDKYHLHTSKPYPTIPIVAVFGVAKNNIGESIAKTFNTTGYTIEEHKVGIDKFINAAKFDAFVFNNGSNNMDWIENQESSKIRDVVESCLTANIVALSEIVRKRIDSKYRTKIVFIGSMAHKAVLNGSAPYCAAKAGLQHFVRCVAYELAPKGFEIFCINPSNVQNSPMSEETIKGLMRYRDLSLEEAKSYWGAECPMGEFLTKGEISSLIRELIMTDKKYLSGTAIDLSGGQR